MPLFLLTYWKQLVFAVLVVSTLSFAAYKIDQNGYDRASAKYELAIEEYNARVDAKLNTLTDLSNTLVTNTSTQSQKIRGDIKAIIDATKNTPPFIIVDGKCEPSPSFIDAYNKSIRKANEKTSSTSTKP